MAYFPLFVDLKDKNVLVVGGGGVAYRKVIKLLPFEANITLVAPEICVELEEVLNSNSNLVYKKKKVDVEDIKQAFIVISATNNEAVNSFVATVCNENNIFVNTVDDIKNCSFIFPALIKEKSLVVGCSTSGKAPDIAAYVKSILMDNLPKNIDEVVENISLLRQNLKQFVSEQNVRAKIIHYILEYYKDNNFELSYNELKERMNNLVESSIVKK